MNNHQTNFKNWCDQSEVIPENCRIYNELLKMFQDADGEIEKVNQRFYLINRISGNFKVFTEDNAIEN